jgi:predicted P-loop ATPase
MTEVIQLPVRTSTDADEHARADSDRKRRLFDWALEVLKSLGLVKAVTRATSIEELRAIVLDLECAEITLAIRDALHPENGIRLGHFQGLREGGLKLILKNRFSELKTSREAILRRRDGKTGRDWTDDLILDKTGKIQPILANLVLILTHAPKWKGVLAFNEFAAGVIIRARPPWGEEKPDTPWTDHHESLARIWFQKEQINPSACDVGRAVQAAAKQNPFHPVRQHFDALRWDGVPRLETWLISYFHAADIPYIRAIGPRYLISAVARIYQPGCKVDHLLVLEGPQGKQKSEALRTLAINDAWFADRLSHVASKDAALEVAGVLLIEIAEMDALTRASSSAIKSFLTRRHDRFRPPYGKHTISLARQCIFAGTINPPVGGYLKDPTGARRFWPVVCQGTVDRDGLEKVRDQLWAEAVHRFKNRAPWWLETPELEALAGAEQTARFAVDAWEAPIREWLGDRTDTTVWEVLEHALGLPPEAWTQSAQNRVAAILTRPSFGFDQHRPRTPNGRRQNRYWREPPLAKSRPPETDHPDQRRK